MEQDGLQGRIEKLFQQQKMCLGLQILLVTLAVAVYQYAIIWLPAHIVVVIFRGGPLSNQATSLAREKYPDIPLRAGRFGKGAGWDPYIVEEAKRRSDDLTVKILKFNHWTVYCFLATMFGNILMWCLSSALVFS